MLIGPLVAQLVTVGAGTRVEGRVVRADDTHYEAAAIPAAAVDIAGKRLDLRFLYSPSFTLTPLEATPSLLVFHTGAVNASYSWRLTTLNIAEVGGYGEQNFRVLATAGAVAPVTSTGTGTTGGTGTGTGTAGGTGTGTGTTTGGTGTGAGAGGTGTGAVTPTGPAPAIGAVTPHVIDQNIRYATSTTSVGLSHLLAPTMSLVGTLAYTVAGAVEAKEKANYPIVQGPFATVVYHDQFDRQNGASAALTVQDSSGSKGVDTWLVSTIETWNHDFDPRTSTQVGAGVAAGRNSRTDGFVAYSVYPTFSASVTSVTLLAPGSLALALTVAAAPAVDPTTLVLDPRVSVGGSVAWVRERLSMVLVGTSAFSVSGNRQNSLSNVGGGAGVAYRFGKAFSMDSGVRVAYQAYGGNTVLPFTYAAYLGMTFALSSLLN